MIVTIDGPSGVGKGTLAKALAEKLHMMYLDTGALYRAVTLKMLQDSKTFSPENAILASQTLTPSELNLLLNDPKLREPEVSNVVSQVAHIESVRENIKTLTKDFIHQNESTHSIILDGRDSGTIVAPQAQVKIYLTADAEIRAKRRQMDYAEKGKDMPFEQVLSDVKKRDESDEANPLIPKPTPDMIWLDSTHMTREQVVEKALSYIKI